MPLVHLQRHYIVAGLAGYEEVKEAEQRWIPEQPKTFFSHGNHEACGPLQKLFGTAVRLC